MKYLQIALFLSSFSSIYGQIVIVNYEQTFINTSINLVQNYDLILTDSLSLYVEKQSIINEFQKDSLSEYNTYNLNTNYKEESNIYYNNILEFKFCETFFSERLFVLEDQNFDDWTLLNESKKIGNYECKLAVKNFRGRKYYAWYTNSFQTFFGPWKFRGLNGLILQVYDESKTFEINAKKINIIDKNNDSLKYNNLIKNTVELFLENKNLYTIIELKKFIENNNEIVLNNIRKQLPRGVELPTKTDENCKECGSLEKY